MLCSHYNEEAISANFPIPLKGEGVAHDLKVHIIQRHGEQSGASSVKVYISVDMEDISSVVAGEHVDINHRGVKPSLDAMLPHRHPPLDDKYNKVLHGVFSGI